MRPIEKYKVGDKVNLGNKTIEIKAEYKPYSDARPILLNNFGEYCSYCENSLHNGTLLDTEHIRPQCSHPELATVWDNFLIGCRECNGSGGKGSKDITVPTMHLPHINNTYLSLVYDEAGGVSVNKDLNQESQENAQALIVFLQLDNSPAKSDKDKDGRCKMRRRTWEIAEKMLTLYENNKCETSLEMLMTVIKERGGWSIWFTVFKEHDEVRKALIEEFPGTAADCFDARDHYNPINRNPGNTVDPV